MENLKQCKSKHSLFSLLLKSFWKACGEYVVIGIIAAIILLFNFYIGVPFINSYFLLYPSNDGLAQCLLSFILIIPEFILGFVCVTICICMDELIIDLIRYIKFLNNLKKLPLTKEECELCGLNCIFEYNAFLQKIARHYAGHYYTIHDSVREELLVSLEEMYTVDAFYDFLTEDNQYTLLAQLLKESHTFRYHEIYKNVYFKE